MDRLVSGRNDCQKKVCHLQREINWQNTVGCKKELLGPSGEEKGTEAGSLSGVLFIYICYLSTSILRLQPQDELSTTISLKQATHK